MKIALHPTYAVITREPTDRVQRMQSESQLLHHVKRTLISMGYNVIKKRMWRDGHMVADTQQYVRERKGKFALYSGFYALRDASEDFNRDGLVTLNVAGDVSTSRGTLEDRKRAYRDCLTNQAGPWRDAPVAEESGA